MTVRPPSFLKRRWPSLLALAAFISAVALVLLAFRAVNAWQRSEARLAERRADAAADLLVTAITRDMRAVHRMVLSSPSFVGLGAHSPPDLGSLSSVFARYPYPEVFFWTSASTTPGTLVFYTRTDRPPAWMTAFDPNNRFPVTVAQDATVSQRLLDRIAQDSLKGHRFSTFDLTMADGTLQVVALLSYTDRTRLKVEAIFGFMVNLDWVKKNYFGELATEVTAMHAAAGDLSLTILDANGRLVAGHAVDAVASPATRRSFPVLFFDPSIVALHPPPDLAPQYWTARATVSGLRVLGLGTRAAMWLVAGNTVALLLAFVLTARAMRTNAELVQMRSDFVSAVTHELKTPVATIRAISETVALGRSGTPEMSREYATLAVHETTRLTRLIDNLLAYSRITDVTDAYSFEPLDIAAIVDLSLKEFRPQLRTAGFSVNIDIAPALPKIRADRAAIVLALGNLVDNAIRYSRTARQLTITARPERSHMVINVTDAGIGIPESDIHQVTQRFFRGNSGVPGGSGLGLAIVERIVGDHSGSLVIRSTVGFGTTVSMSVPIMSQS